MEDDIRLHPDQELEIVRILDRYLRHSRAQFHFDNDMVLEPAVRFLSPNFTTRYPAGIKRLYVEMEQYNKNGRQVCLNFDDVTDMWCGNLPQSEPIYFNTVPTRTHVISVTRKRNHSPTEKHVLAQSHFYVSVPSIDLTIRKLYNDRARVQISLSEWCNGVEGVVILLLDDTTVVTPDLNTGDCTMAPDEKHSACFEFVGVPSGEHTVRAMLVTKDGNALDSTRAIVLESRAREDISDPTRSECSSRLTWPRSAISGCEQATCPPFALPTARPLPRTTVLPWLQSLRLHEWGRFSQNGEDGVLVSLLKLVRPNFSCDHDADSNSRRVVSADGGAANFYVEFGVEDGAECNTKFLREKCGWTGLQMDGGYEDETINLHRHFINAENINQLFEMHDVPPNLSVLSIDIDNNDFWVWKNIEAKYRPEIVIVEYNAHIKPSEARVVPYVADRMWDGFSAYFGAGVAALAKLARAKGYSLVYCESHGVNCFFVRDDLLGLDVSKEDGMRVDEIYRPPNFFNAGFKYPFPKGRDNHSEWLWVQ
eukprot:g1059.t1